jgi:hypothetical protein
VAHEPSYSTNTFLGINKENCPDVVKRDGWHLRSLDLPSTVSGLFFSLPWKVVNIMK